MRTYRRNSKTRILELAVIYPLLILCVSSFTHLAYCQNIKRLNKVELPPTIYQTKLDTTFKDVTYVNKTVFIDKDILLKDITIPSDITLVIKRNGTIHYKGNVIIEGSISAAPRKIFVKESIGKLILAPNSSETVFPQWWGAKADWNGFSGTDDTSAINSAWSTGRTVLMAGRYRTTDTLHLSSGTRVLSDSNSEIISDHASYMIKAFDVSNCEISGLTLDMRFSSETALLIKGSKHILLSSDTIRNMRRNVKNFRGGAIIVNSSNVHIKNLTIQNIENDLGQSRALSFTGSTSCNATNVQISNVDKAYHISGSQGILLENVSATNVNDNGVYIIGNASDITIKYLHLRNVGEGIVCNSISNQANVRIENFEIIKAQNKAITLRTGNGYSFFNGIIRGGSCGIGESNAFEGSNNVLVTNVEMYDVVGKPVYISKGSNITLKSVTHLNSKTGKSIQLNKAFK